MVFTGRVFDAHTGQPVANAVLSCVGAKTVHYCRSDEMGRFGFIGIDGGCWEMWVSKPPYSEHSNSYCHQSNLEVNIFLNIEGLDDEVVTA